MHVLLLRRAGALLLPYTCRVRLLPDNEGLKNFWFPFQYSRVHLFHPILLGDRAFLSCLQRFTQLSAPSHRSLSPSQPPESPPILACAVDSVQKICLSPLTEESARTMSFLSGELSSNTANGPTFNAVRPRRQCSPSLYHFSPPA